jgi:hypothetical protein
LDYSAIRLNARAIDEERLNQERDRWIAGWKRLITLGQPAGG